MATLTNTAAHWANSTPAKTTTNNFLTRLSLWADEQAPNKTAWFLVSLIAQGVLFLPLPAVFMYYFHAPIVVLAITLALFFANIIAGMGGSGIKTLLGLLAVSVVTHVLMLLIFLI
ncbi:hypothetical protein [Mucilaginibacter psychrotolerans]|uniref:Uncharacterized protein n=1 Tax=Mucilaginibacter psychrotolerans TaxID=1524096 RepID=A0A4Y8SAD4_9SPHI|nr:hypothetical protein [Mucilaginibacter psychrotolerans]TFF35404.1 hypothetical protein E2R66_19305 [Mucilaginibacter psychrotolerans]